MDEFYYLDLMLKSGSSDLVLSTSSESYCDDLNKRLDKVQAHLATNEVKTIKDLMNTIYYELPFLDSIFHKNKFTEHFSNNPGKEFPFQGNEEEVVGKMLNVINSIVVIYDKEEKQNLETQLYVYANSYIVENSVGTKTYPNTLTKSRESLLNKAEELARYSRQYRKTLNSTIIEAIEVVFGYLLNIAGEEIILYHGTKPFSKLEHFNIVREIIGEQEIVLPDNSVSELDERLVMLTNNVALYKLYTKSLAREEAEAVVAYLLRDTTTVLNGSIDDINEYAKLIPATHNSLVTSRLFEK